MVIAHLARMHPRIDHPSLLSKPPNLGTDSSLPADSGFQTDGLPASLPVPVHFYMFQWPHISSTKQQCKQLIAGISP